jgi:hypothetical protein
MKSLAWKTRAKLGVSMRYRNDYADYDYLHKLDKETLEWLKGFHREWANSDFKHKHTKIYHDQQDKREIYGLNNSRQRDLYNQLKWNRRKQLVLFGIPPSFPYKNHTSTTVLDNLIEVHDKLKDHRYSRKIQMLLSVKNSGKIKT